VARQAGNHDSGDSTWEAQMTSATIRQAKGASRGEGYWMVVFAASLLGVVGSLNVIEGIAAIARSHVFTTTGIPPSGARSWKAPA
jgi:hypothetical protein